MRKSSCVVCFLVAMSGCVTSDDPALSTGPTCVDDLVPGAVVPLTAELPSSEGVAFTDDGRLFVSQPQGVFEVFPDGATELVATFDSAVGLAVTGNVLYVAGFNSGRVERWEIGSDTTETVAAIGGNPNFVVPTPWGTLLVSDDLEPNITEIQPDGSFALWSDAVASPNGMVFSADGSTLYVASTFTDPGLWAIPVSDGRPAGAARLVVAFAGGDTPDGVARDADGNIYVALNLVDTVVRVSPDGEVETLSDQLSNPASLAFGRVPFDPCSLYITDLTGGPIARVRVY